MTTRDSIKQLLSIMMVNTMYYKTTVATGLKVFKLSIYKIKNVTMLGDPHPGIKHSRLGTSFYVN